MSSGGLYVLRLCILLSISTINWRSFCRVFAGAFVIIIASCRALYIGCES